MQDLPAGVKKYQSIFRSVEIEYTKLKSTKTLFELFKTQLIREFKLDITFDPTIVQAILKRLLQQHQKSSQSDRFAKLLQLVKKFGQVLLDNSFIAKREYNKIIATTADYQNNPSVRWAKNMAYLKNAEDSSDFRIDFFQKIYSNQEFSEDQLERLVQNEEEVEKRYKQFWSSLIENSSIKIELIANLEDCFSNVENKKQMLGEELSKALDRKLGIHIGSDEKEILINKTLISIAENNAYENSPEIKRKLESEINKIEKVMMRFSGLNVFKGQDLKLKLGKFGSVIGGFAAGDADIDLTILTNCYINEKEFLSIVYEFLTREYKEVDRMSGKRTKIDLILTAKTPLITVTIIERGAADMKIDILVNNLLGIINSKFLKVYSKVRWIRNLGLLLKLWGKATKIIDKQWYSSYSIVLMLIHFLIIKKKVKLILDNRVISTSKPHFEYRRIKQNLVEEFDVYYQFKNEVEDVTDLERVNYFKILKSFFKYYADQIFKEPEEDRLITVDGSYNKKLEEDFIFTIKDPFDKSHNPGRVKKEQTEYIRDKFKQAYDILNSKAYDIKKISDLFMKGK